MTTVTALASFAVIGWGAVIARRRLPNRPRHAWAWIVAALGVVAATWLIGAYDSLTHQSSDIGPHYYWFSSYQRYRTDDLLEVVVVASSAFLAGALAVGSLATFHRPGHEIAGTVLAGLTCAAVAAPAIVPASLPRLEQDKDPILRTGELPEIAADGTVSACLDYGATGETPSASTPRLCLSLSPTPQALALTHPAPPITPDSELSDIARVLNEQGVRERDIPTDPELSGIEIQTVAWE